MGASSCACCTRRSIIGDPSSLISIKLEVLIELIISDARVSLSAKLAIDGDSVVSNLSKTKPKKIIEGTDLSHDLHLLPHLGWLDELFID